MINVEEAQAPGTSTPEEIHGNWSWREDVRERLKANSNESRRQAKEENSAAGKGKRGSGQKRGDHPPYSWIRTVP